MGYLTKNKEIELLRKNVKDLQGQLQNAYIRIKKLNEALHFEKASNNPDHPFTTATGWANLEHWDSENPDASFIKENKDE